ncbi:MAG: AarF/UbiB family protein, partial [Acidobacteriota bacterium]|nr:AarF/UbiB family protein [Acidobacteriota bacterium]
MENNKQGLILQELPTEAILAEGDNLNGNGASAIVPTKKLLIEQQVSNEQLIAEQQLLSAKEAEIEKNYQGFRGYLRLFQVSKVIGNLALYLYLDQYDLHHAQHLKQSEARMETAKRLTWLAVLGEKFRNTNLAFFHDFILLLRWFFIGGEKNKETNQEKQAVWLKDNLINLGPTFIKIGQSLGTRADLLPLPFVKALGELQDNVPSFPNSIAFARIEKELGRKINEVYAEFDIAPVAAASLGQVYRAKLFTGEEVAVKVQRPNLTAIIKGDIEILRKVAKFAERFPSLNENADWAGMLREFDETVHEEMDYAAEGKNAERFHESFKDWTNVHVPKIYWHATSSKVLTMEFIHGTKVTALDELRARNVSPEKVNRLLIR